MAPYERDRLAASFERQFKRALQIIIEAEVKLIKKTLGIRAISLDDIYISEIPKHMKRYMRPLQWGYYEAIYTATQNEIGLSLAEHKGQLDDFTRKYIQVFQVRYTASHGAQLKGLENLDEVAERLQEWLLTGSARRAADEVTRQGQATFRQCVTSTGMSVVWRTRGKPCPFCAQLNGKRVGGSKPFVDKMTDMTATDPEGKDVKVKIFHKTLSPPLHRKCRCFLSTQ